MPRIDLAALDPRTRLICTAVLLVPLIWRPSPAVVWLYLSVLALVTLWSGSTRQLARGIIPVAWVAAGLILVGWATTYVPLLFSQTSTPPGLDGLAEIATLSVRMIDMVALGLLMAASIPPGAAAAATSWFLSPMRRLGLDTEVPALMVLLVLRFVPLFARELTLTNQAMLARGIAFGPGPFEQVRRLTALAVPVLNRLLVDADDLGAALVSRGYGLNVASTWADLRFRWPDAALLLLSGAFVALSFGL